ncbi:MAG: hypothetical protein LHW61_06680 [Candidatus Cloacimonetes bacterium]|nr:hypothetical protein [Candidatus Cloacimonadota bacterium]
MRYLFCIFLILLSCFLAAATVVPGGYVSGIWTVEDSPYLINGNITIPDGESLNLHPGVELQFQGYYTLKIEGKLQAIGTPSDSIKFSTTSSEQKWRGIIMQNVAATNDSTILRYCAFNRGDAKLDILNKNGGIIRVLNSSKLIIEHCCFSYATADSGGALYAKNSTFRIKDCIFHNCSATYDGGAIFTSLPDLNNETSLYIENCTFKSNSAGKMGGGVTLCGGSHYIITSKISNNYAQNGGGGISFKNNCHYLCLNNLIVNNGTSHQGGGINSSTYSPGNLIINNTICNNTANINSPIEGPGGMYIRGYAGCYNNIIWGNSSALGQIGIRVNGMNQLYDYNAIENGLDSFNISWEVEHWSDSQYGNHNITGCPEFIQPSMSNSVTIDGLAADWRLNQNSPCRNAGNPLTDISLYPYDLAGNPRILDNCIDIGAYEYGYMSIPQIPQNVRIIKDSSELYLIWDPVTQDVNGIPISNIYYNIYQAINPDGVWEFLGSSTNPVFIVDSETHSQAYFRVSAARNP